MVCEGGIHVVYGEGEVDFVVAEVVWAVHVAKPGELELMNGASITEVDELKTSVSSIFFADYGESECIFVRIELIFLRSRTFKLLWLNLKFIVESFFLI